jgi:hypothetical protein
VYKSLILSAAILGASTISAFAQDITINGVLRSYSALAAIQYFCTPYYAVNPVAAGKMEAAFAEVAEKVGGSAMRPHLKAELVRRYKEVKVTGAEQWCAYQRDHFRAIGMNELFP